METGIAILAGKNTLPALPMLSVRSVEFLLAGSTINLMFCSRLTVKWCRLQYLLFYYMRFKWKYRIDMEHYIYTDNMFYYIIYIMRIKSISALFFATTFLLIFFPKTVKSGEYFWLNA